MASRHEEQGQGAEPGWRGVPSRILRRVPPLWRARGRSALPWAGAIALNLVIFLMAISVRFDPPLRGVEDAEEVVTVFVVPPSMIEPPEAPEPDEPEETVEATAGAEDPTLETEQEDLTESEATGAMEAAPPQTASTEALPEVALPETDPGRGRPDGIVAINCNLIFSDPDKAAECAGREILSGWRADPAIYGEEWAEMARQLRRGGVDQPLYGPDPLAGMSSGERVISRPDPRFTTDIERAAAAAREAAARRAGAPVVAADSDENLYPNQAGTEAVPLSGWQPSWQQRGERPPPISPEVRRELEAVAAGE